MLVLHDCDVHVYRVGYASQDVDENIAIARMSTHIALINKALKADDYKLFLTSQDKSNFRFEIYPDYKANRTQPKPIHYLALRNFCIDNLDAEVVEGMEADDALGLAQTENTIITSIDKDLDQISGKHYNFVKERYYEISPIEAARTFYYQLLVGDVSDNVEGCRGIGAKKATRILEGCQEEIEMLEAVVNSFQRNHPNDWLERIMLAGKLLWIRKRNRNEWDLNGEVVSKNMLETYSIPLE